MYLDCKHPNSLGYDMRKACWVVYEGAAVYTKECFSESVNARGRKEGRVGGGRDWSILYLIKQISYMPHSAGRISLSNYAIHYT